MKKSNIITRYGYMTVLPLRRLALLVVAAVMLGIGMVAVSRVSADDDTTTADSRVITLFDRGVERSFRTTESTIRGALTEAGVELDARDRVEPGLDEVLVANEYAVNVYRARPLLIVDGSVRQIIMTAAQVPDQIIDDAGLTLYDEDLTRLERSDSLFVDGAAEQLIVTRAISFEFTLYGKTFTARTQAKTVGDVLREKEVTIGTNDRVSLPLDTSVAEGMKLRVWREGRQTITKDEKVNFEVEQIQDANRPVGYRSIKTPGQNGVRAVTYEVTIRDGKEVKRKEISSVTKKAPKKQVEIVGAKVKEFGGSCSSWMAAAGITDMANATYLINAESGCNPHAVNASSGACGVGQALPCGKTGCEMGDGACQTRWMNSYVMGRYGSWQAAADHHRRMGWY